MIDIETGKEVLANKRGEICVKSVSVMLGYWNRPDATKQTIDEEGWLHTGKRHSSNYFIIGLTILTWHANFLFFLSLCSGDIGYYDDEGCFFVVDRLKELIKVKGFQVS